MSQSAKRVVLVSRPVGEPKASDFRVEDYAVPTPGRGRGAAAHHLAVARSLYARAHERRAVLCGAGADRRRDGRRHGQRGDRVEQSRLSPRATSCCRAPAGRPMRFPTARACARSIRRLAPISTAVGVLGMPGMTAYTGLLDIGKPQAGETVVVAAASGAVGSAVGQIAKIKGARAVGIAGGKDKCDYVKKELGFDDCLDHRDPDLAAKLKDACPKGIDVYFENVGGAVFEAVFPLLNAFARMPVCGLIAEYNNFGETSPKWAGKMMRAVLTKRLTIRGFIVSDFAAASRRFPARHVELGARGQGQAQGVRHRRPRQRARRLHGPAEGRQFRQAAGARRAGQGLTHRRRPASVSTASPGRYRPGPPP